MDTVQEYRGYWYFNSDEDDCYSGTLKNDNETGISLQLLGCTEFPKGDFIVNGNTSCGKQITLSECYVSQRTMSMPGIPTAEISSTYCFIGRLLSCNEMTFNIAEINISSLDLWLGVTGIKIPSKNPRNLSLNYSPPEEIILYSSSEITYKVIFTCSYSLKRNNSFILNQNAILKIEASKRFDLKDFFKHLSILDSFFTLAYFSEPQIEKIRLFQDDISYDFNYLGQFNSNVTVKVHRRNFLFDYNFISYEVQEVFKTWIDLFAPIEPVINTLQECFRNRTILVENKFLNVMHGIETFHRRRRINDREPKGDHKQKVQKILDTCPEEYRYWLKDKLSFSNEPSLQARLESLFGEIDESLKQHLFPDFEEIIRNAKQSRNYYTHYEKTLEKKALKMSDLHYLTERLKIFLLILLLKETGLTGEKINQIIKDGSQYLFNHLIDRKLLSEI